MKDSKTLRNVVEHDNLKGGVTLMYQKTTWTNCLIIGISSLFIIQWTSCKSEDSNIAPLNVTIIYQNQTSKNIQYFQPTEKMNFLVFEVEAFGAKKIEISSEYDAGAGLSSETCCEGVFESLQGRNNAVLVEFDESKCLTFESGEGPTTQNISGYDALILSDNDIEFTYMFTEEDYMKAGECE